VTWDCLVWDLDGTLLLPGSATPAPAVAGVLAARREAGTVLAVATSAPTASARRLVALLGWDALFDHVAGSAPGVADKTAIVAEALLALGRPDGGAGAVAVIGDSAGDMAAARELGLVAIGAAWCGARPAVLRDAGAALVLDDPTALPAGPEAIG
jgi:phosphoglycolate phosphatase